MVGRAGIEGYPPGLVNESQEENAQYQRDVPLLGGHYELLLLIKAVLLLQTAK